MSSSEPDPASGPGVYPPFAAPPSVGTGKRLGIALGIGGAVLVLCCGGGIFAFVGIGVAARDQQVNGARTVVTKYMTAWQRRDYSGAYQLLCFDLKDVRTSADFARELGTDQVTGFSVEEPEPIDDGMEVGVSATFESHGSRTLTYDVIVDSDGSSKICGLDQ